MCCARCGAEAAAAAGISRLLLLESCPCSVLSCPVWRAALGRCCREGLGSCLHCRFSLSLSSACLFADDIVRGRHSDKFHTSLLACLNLTQECAPSLSPSPSPPWLRLTTRGSEQHVAFLGQAQCLAALDRKQTLKLACGFGSQPCGNLCAAGQGWCRARIPGVPILPSWLSPWLPPCSGLQVCWACPGQNCGIVVLTYLLPALA